jgi:uncharacterized membrane protein
MFGRLTWILWNLFLAAIPVALGYSIAAVGRQLTWGRRRWLWVALVPLLGLWLIFLPNSCYLFTELRHLFSDLERYNLWSRARSDPDAAMGLALRIGVALLYSMTGALTFALSIRPVKSWMRSLGVPTDWASVPFFLVVSLGVYLGLVVRYNSWDLLTRPGRVLETVVRVLHHPLLMAVIVLFAVFLWLAYEVNDIWIDGFMMRWEQWLSSEVKKTEPDLVASAGRR